MEKKVNVKKDKVLEVIKDNLMMLTMCRAEREEDGSRVYDEEMIEFAIDALNSVYEEIEEL